MANVQVVQVCREESVQIGRGGPIGLDFRAANGQIGLDCQATGRGGLECRVIGRGGLVIGLEDRVIGRGGLVVIGPGIDRD